MSISESQKITLEKVLIDGEDFYRISNVDQMNPFLMSIVSNSNHWMFIASNGGLTAGRKNSEHALFPYYTDDKLVEAADITGSKSIFQVTTSDGLRLWEPFSERQEGQYRYTRNLYKNFYGNKVLFEEMNHDLGLTFQYQWNSSDAYGFVKKSTLSNHSDKKVAVTFLDGIQNIMPYGVSPDLQGIRSNLVDAYKKNELEANVGLGIYALSAIIVDRAEPSEALKANIVWSLGLEKPVHLLCSDQLPQFRKGKNITPEVDIKARKGAYFISKEITLDKGEQKHWMMIAEVDQTATTIATLSERAQKENNLEESINQDIEVGSRLLENLVAASDGIHYTADAKRNARHYSNTLFNIMRGGIFDNNYTIEKWDFENYLRSANKLKSSETTSLLSALPAAFSLQELRSAAEQSGDEDLKRLSLEYMPLKFSRRHGDPSRPWNRFSINTKSEVDGSKILDYEGNWRDIFQNWEALAQSYPEFLESMIFKFLNASTFDGYNPYRVTKDGFDWEVIEENDPWSYIGYWGDHQIIYLLKFLESIQAHFPDRLPSYFNEELFVYANVPYKIKEYEDLLKTPKDTILFDHDLDLHIQERRSKMGSDGALLLDAKGEIYKVSLIEKILATTLAKLSNFIPEAGIWMNTQRPEWNDANNALVGNGVSMVTLYYLRRFLSFFKSILPEEGTTFSLSVELGEFFEGIKNTFEQNQDLLNAKISDKKRKAILDGLGRAGSTYRTQIYKKAFSGQKSTIHTSDLVAFLDTSLAYLEHAIRANKRDDNMYHAYNIMTVENAQEVSISYLDEMLEGQVGVLSSGYLAAEESLQLLDALKSSKLFREDQYSYLLYPNKELPRFVNKNVVPEERVESSTLLKTLIEKGDTRIIERDLTGAYHFNGNFNNAESLKMALDQLSAEGHKDLVKAEYDQLLKTFEAVFNHKAFTGRSGTFFGYEGLGSIYWHMVSKLLLSVAESCLHAVEEKESPEVTGRLMEHYYEINEGIGVHKPPALYGAFSIDPYSHTPANKGVQQPGMTGQVKEDILSRIGELGVSVNDTKLSFNPSLLRGFEFFDHAETFHYVDVREERKSIALESGSLAFTYCQVPVIYKIADRASIEVTFSSGVEESMDSSVLSKSLSQKVFDRTGEIERIQVSIPKANLK